MQRKPKPKRLFNGMAGSAFATVDEAVVPQDPGGPTEPSQEPTIAAAPRKRGRPAANGVAMTAAQRTAKSRANKAAKLEDKGRRDIAAKFVKSYRRMLPVLNPMDPSYRERVTEHRGWLRKFHNDLMALTLVQLKAAMTVWEETPDHHGRLDGETSGEDKRKFGMSGLERVIAAQDRSARGRVTPEGAGPASDDADSEPASFRPPSGRRLPEEHVKFLDDREEIIGEIIAKFYQHGECRTCGAFIPDASDARQHWWREYEKGLDAYEKYLDLNQPGITELAPFIVEEARVRYLQNKHLSKIWFWVRDRRETRRQATRKARRA